MAGFFELLIFGIGEHGFGERILCKETAVNNQEKPVNGGKP
jgi:hypothetical protein